MSVCQTQITYLDDLLATSGGAADPSVLCVEDIAQSGSYGRRPPFQMDTEALEREQSDLLATYLACRAQEHGPVRHLILKDALVTGQGTVITRDLRLVRESAAEFIAHGRIPTNFLGLEADTASIDLTDVIEVSTPSLLVKRPWYLNYGHWLVDGAALLALAPKMTLPNDWQIAVAMHAEGPMRRIVNETLNILAPGIPVAEHSDSQIWRVRELHYVSPVSVPPLFKLPESLACFRSILLHDHLPAVRLQKGIFVTRGCALARRLINENEIAAICQSLGLRVVSPESMSLRDQAILFRSCCTIVGVKGASLTNALFCAPSTHVVALSPGDFPDPFFWDVVAQQGGAYSEMFGKVTEHCGRQGGNPFYIDPNKFRAVLQNCLAEIPD